MTNELTDKLSPYEEFLIEAARESRDRFPEKSVQLIVKNGIGNYIYTVPFREGKKESELADDIGAKTLQKYNINSRRVQKFDNLSKDSDNLVNREEYLVITDNVPDTKRRIQDYKNKNETIAHANNTKHALDVMNSYNPVD